MLLISSSLNFLGHFPEIHNLITERGSNFQKELFFCRIASGGKTTIGKIFQALRQKSLKI